MKIISISDPPSLTAKEVADRLSVSKNTILRWIATRGLPVIRMPGGSFRIETDELQNFLEMHQELKP